MNRTRTLILLVAFLIGTGLIVCGFALWNNGEMYTQCEAVNTGGWGVLPVIIGLFIDIACGLVAWDESR